MSRKLDTIVAECLSALEKGATVEQCLQRYPRYADDLRPLLETWAALQQVPPAPVPHPAVIAHGKARMFEAVERRFAPQPRRSLFGNLRLPRWAPAAAMIVIVAMGMAGTTTLAASALPGDLLYPVKTATESLQLFFTFSPEARAELEAELQAERLEELAAVLAEGRTVEINFWGPLGAWNAESWTVAGYTVRIDPGTTIEGTPVIGARVDVWATTTADGELIARRLVVTPPPDLTPHGLIPTPTHSAPHPSATPRREQEHRTVTPTPRGGHTPTPTPTPTPRPTDEPTPTPMPTPMPTESHHEEPSPTREHHQDHTPTPPPPTSTPQPTLPCGEHTPTPTMSPMPSMTPTPPHSHQHSLQP